MTTLNTKTLGEVIVTIQYPDKPQSWCTIKRTLAVSPKRGSDGRLTKRPYREVNWLGQHFGLTEEGARRVLAELDEDVNEGRATLVEINDALVGALR